MRLIIRNKIYGFGLFEILISLAIFAMGIISITSLNVKSFKVVKNNELMDFADRTMIKALEYFKSPTTTGVQATLEAWMANPPNTGGKVYTYIKNTSLVDENGILEFGLENYNGPTISDCTAGNYKLRMASGSKYEGFNICEQVLIEKMTNGYKITSIVVYKIDVSNQADSQTKINQLVGYRPFTYAESIP